MSSSKPIEAKAGFGAPGGRAAALVAGLFALVALAACTFSPVYSDRLAGGPSGPAFAYAEPGSRLEQIIYHELRLRFGASEAPDAPLLSVRVASRSGLAGMSGTTSPNTPRRATVTGRVTITARDGSETPPVVVERMASAEFNTSAQALASSEATIEASERAARAVAESLRLGILAQLSR